MSIINDTIEHPIATALLGMKDSVSAAIAAGNNASEHQKALVASNLLLLETEARAKHDAEATRKREQALDAREHELEREREELARRMNDAPAREELNGQGRDVVAAAHDGFSTPGAPFTIARNANNGDGTWRFKTTISSILNVMKSNTAKAQEDIAKATQLLLCRIPHGGNENNSVQSALDSNITLVLQLQNGVTSFIAFSPADKVDNDMLTEKFSQAATLANDWGQVHRKACVTNGCLL
jgi:hypothetical protein